MGRRHSFRRGVLSYRHLPINYHNRTRPNRPVCNYIDQSRAYEHLRPSVSHTYWGKKKWQLSTRHRNRFLSEEKSFRTINRRESPCEQSVCSYRLRGFLRKCNSVFAKNLGREIRHLRTRVIEILTCKKKTRR